MVGWLANFFANLATQIMGVSTMIGALISIVVAMLFGVIYWHRKRIKEGKTGVEPSHLIIFGLIGAAFCMAIAAGGYAWQQWVPTPQGTAIISHSSHPISSQEQQFREEMRRFIKSNFDEIRDGMYTVNQSITNKYDETRGSQPTPLTRMFFQLFGTAIRPNIDAVDKAYALQDDEFDTSAVQDLIKKAMQSYVQWQDIVLQFQQVSGISLADRSFGILLGADERAFGKLRDLKAFSHATKLNDLDERSVFASRNGVFSQWNDPSKK